MALFDQPEEFPGTCHVATLTDIDEVARGADVEQLKARQLKMVAGWGWLAGLNKPTFSVLNQGRELRDKLVGRSAAAADDVHDAGVHIGLHLACHLRGGLVIKP